MARESALWAKGCRYVAGLDEVGRGPLAGPVVAAAVVLPQNAKIIAGLRDSKQMTARQRDRVAAVIRDTAAAWAVGAASPREIDRLNILGATALAMRRALSLLSQAPDHVLVDGNPFPELRCEHEAIVKGDATCLSIAAASVLAKQARDRLMILLASRFPAFGWEQNMGYGTAEHLAAIEANGLTPHHRRSFGPVSQLRLFS
ncbi:MAG: ribonuclease HII [Gemmatimonadetes bacterium]|nr:ribonuclease HII [Gemmatimonadota bacterium]MCH8254608.1 ribonuclease HII [Gemmatimonadota bacterium]